jgi:hypothetical protein
MATISRRSVGRRRSPSVRHGADSVWPAVWKEEEGGSSCSG